MGKQWTSPPDRRTWFPGWNGYEDVPAYEKVATPWAAESVPQIWAETANPLPGQLPLVPLEAFPAIDSMAGIQGGVEYQYVQQHLPPPGQTASAQYGMISPPVNQYVQMAPPAQVQYMEQAVPNAVYGIPA